MNKPFKIKDTLLMLKTTFGMKGNLSNKELLIQNKWKKDNVYGDLLEKTKNSPIKIIFDGPPYANGSIHIGHAVNKILKDIYVRYYFANNYYSEFIMGYDTHGLPIENQVFKDNINNSMNTNTLRTKCMEFAISQIELQNSQFAILGLLAIDNKKYETFNHSYEQKQLELFFKIYEEKLVYKELRPIRWSWSSKTALAESEIEYKNVKSPSVYLKFKIISGELKDKYAVIWTTTPWTLPGNFAISYGSNIVYSLYKYKGEELLMAEKLKSSIEDKLKTKLTKIKNIDIKIIRNSTYLNHITKKEHKFISADHVKCETGTGLVHTSPFHGEDDFIVAKKNKIESNPIIDKNGHMINSNKYNSLFYLKANKVIINDLINDNSVLFHEEFSHEYPHDWRTHKPIVFLATEQWFIDIKIKSKDIISYVNKIDFYPSWGKKRLRKMIQGRQSWCISRQRRWGVPIPIFYDSNNKPIFDKLINEHLISLFKKHGSDIWFNKSIDELLPNNLDKDVYKNWTKELDIMDVWFDSGIAYEATKNLYNREISNTDYIFIEGSDQYRGWFNSSSIISGIFSNEGPAKEIITHGFVLDKNNNKMSKSKGNVVNPLKICSTDGADILRLWVASVDFHSDIPFSDESLKTIRDNYRKIRNTLRFLIGNIYDFEFKKYKDILDGKEIIVNKTILNEFDSYIISKLNKIINKCHDDYKKYNLLAIIKAITNFCISDLSNKYLDVSKDIIYVDKKDSIRRRQFQLSFLIIALSLVKLLSPIIPHTCEEWYSSLKEIVPFKISKSVHTLTSARQIKLLDKINYEKIGIINDEFFNSLTYPWGIATKNRSLENITFNSTIKNKIETKIVIIFKSNYKNINQEDILKVYSFADVMICQNKNELKNIKDENIAYSSLKDKTFKDKQSIFKEIIILKHDGEKCTRCWKYYNSLSNDEQPLCNRCLEVVKSYQ